MPQHSLPPPEPGNQRALGANHSVHALTQSKLFREKCLAFLAETGRGVLTKEKLGAFAILEDIAVGYKGVKPTDRISAIALMLKVCGMLTDKVEIENVNPYRDMDNATLVAMAERLVVAVKSPAPASLEDPSGGAAGVVGGDGA